MRNIQRAYVDICDWLYVIGHVSNCIFQTVRAIKGTG